MRIAFRLIITAFRCIRLTGQTKENASIIVGRETGDCVLSKRQKSMKTTSKTFHVASDCPFEHRAVEGCTIRVIISVEGGGFPFAVTIYQ